VFKLTSLLAALLILVTACSESGSSESTERKTYDELKTSTIDGEAIDHDGVALTISEARVVDSEGEVSLTFQASANNAGTTPGKVPALFIVCGEWNSPFLNPFGEGRSPYVQASSLPAGDTIEGPVTIKFPTSSVTNELAECDTSNSQIEARWNTTTGGGVNLVNESLDAGRYPLTQQIIDDYNTAK